MKFRLMAGLLLFLMFNLCLASPVAGEADKGLVLMWQVQKKVTDEDLSFLKNKGVNLIQSFLIGTWKDEEVQEYLDKAYRNEIGVVMPALGVVRKIGKEWRLNPKEAHIRFINKWKSHPAVFAWLIFDEPSNRNKRIPKKTQEEAYKFIKSLDLKNKVMLTWNGISNRHYNCCFSEDSFDILDIHAYINRSIGSRQNNLIKNYETHRKKDYPVIITIRTYNGPRRSDLSDDGLQSQYEFFFLSNNLTRNVGFYGWQLGRNMGISQHPDIMRQFKELDIRIDR